MESQWKVVIDVHRRIGQGHHVENNNSAAIATIVAIDFMLVSITLLSS